MQKSRFRLPGEIILLIAAIVWGTSFVAQSVGSENVESFTFNGVRCLIGALVLFLTVKVIGYKPSKEEQKKLWLGGAVCGVLLFFAVNLQQLAISYVDAAGNKALVGKVGFLTALYILFVPIIGIFFRKKTGFIVWISVVIAVIGAYLLTGGEAGAGKMNLSDLYAILCAVMFALQIIAVDKYAPDVDCIRLSMVQFIVCGVLSMITAFLFEEPNLPSLMDAKWSILYSGIMSSGIAYTLQMLGQKNCRRPQVASLIMSLESVICTLSGFVFLHQTLSARELIGCALMFTAVVLTQVKTGEANG